MNKALPDKWIRKRVYDLINNMEVDNYLIPCYDTRVTHSNNSDKPQFFSILSTQSNEVDKSNKCEYFWESNILIDVHTIYEGQGNMGSRVLADDIMDSVRALLNDFQLDSESGLEVISSTPAFPADIATTTNREQIFRKLIRLELLIK